MSIISDLKKIVSELGSQKAAAEALDTSPQLVSFILNGQRHPSKELAYKLGWEKFIGWRRIKNGEKPRTGAGS